MSPFAKEIQTRLILFVAFLPPHIHREICAIAVLAQSSLDLEETITAGAGWNSDCFAHVSDRCNGPFEQTPLLIIVEVIEQVGVTDELGNETVGQGHGMRLPGRPTGVNKSPAALPLDRGFGALL